jgi:hypothetical protein
MWVVFAVSFVLALGEGISGVRVALTDPAGLKGVIWPGGALGAIVAHIILDHCSDRPTKELIASAKEGLSLLN